MPVVNVKRPMHDCATPNMVKEVVTHRQEQGFWRRLFFEPVEWDETIYHAEEAKWCCPVCKTEWYFGYIVRGTWSVVNQGPESWEWVDI